MSSRGSHRISVARHVYLRTQQHRLRHVKSVVVRNLTLSELNLDLSANPLSMETYFTIHPTNNPDKVLYKSYPVHQSYNPSWEAVQFSPQLYEKYSAISSLILQLWIRVGSSNEAVLAFEKSIDLASLVYLGTLVNKDGSPYPPNSVIVGMYEGYYSHPGVGGVPCPPKITHALEKLLPPQSLLEVNKLEVRDSYIHPTLLQLIGRQEMLNLTTTAATHAHDNVEALMSMENDWFEKRRERELLRMRLAILRSQLVEKEREENEERNQLCRLQGELDTKQQTLTVNQEDLKQDKEQYKQDYDAYLKRREMLVRAKRNQLLRQKNMISDAAYTFFITELRDKFTICNVILQNSDQLDQPSSVEQPGVALGYVAHLVHHLAQILLVPLQYEIRPNGSRSHICDYISDEAIIDDIREFPLFLKGVERALFHYAVHLLNKDIAQIRQHCGYGMSKSMLKKTLPNLKFLVEKIISELSTKSDSTNTHDSSFISSTPMTPTQSSLPIGSPMAVPTGGARKLRERQETLSTSSPSTPQISFSTEPDAYGASLSSMSFQPSEGEGSRPMSPLCPQSSHDSASVESSEQSFYNGFQLSEQTGDPQNCSSTLQYPAMQHDLTGHNCSKPTAEKLQGSSFPIPPSFPSPVEDETSSQTVEGNSHLSDSSKHQQQDTVAPPSSAHADLHCFQFSESPASEEMSSAGITPTNNAATDIVLRTDNTIPHSTEQGDEKRVHNGKSRTLPMKQQELRNTGDLFSDTSCDHHDCPQQQVDYTPSANHTNTPNKVTTTSKRGLDTVSYQHSVIDTGYTTAGLATPHRIGEEDATPLNGNTNMRTARSSDKDSATDGELLEHFIDGF